MPEIRCPNCGRNNPDLLDICQFCQTPLKPESILHSGEKPTKKNTGELESILPDWLKDVHQRAKDSADETAQTFTSSSSRKDEPPDLLAGLASQSGSGDEDDIPDWLASINPTAKPVTSVPSAGDAGSDFFARFNQKESQPEPPQEETPSWAGDVNEPSAAPAEKDELSDWFTQASGQPEEIVELEDEQSDMGWGGTFVPSASTESSSPKEEEDLSWLHNLEAEAKQTGELQTPKKETDWMADFQTPSATSPSSSQDDLSWLDRLGGIEEPSKPAPEQPAAQSNDLSWLNQFGGLPETSPPSQPVSSMEDLSWLDNFESASESAEAATNQPAQPSPFAREEDLDWLNKLGGPSEPAQPSQPFSVPEEKQPAKEDLSWLNNLGTPSEPSAASTPTPQEDLSWLNDLGGASEPLSAPPFESEIESQETPLTPAIPSDEKTVEEAEPDWLKSAAEARSMPSLSDLSTDWFAGTRQPEQEKAPPSTPHTSPFETDSFVTPAEPSSLSNQDVDSLFSVDMPDWLSRPESETAAPTSSQTGMAAPVEGDESLAPVDLPSWVQAMRPVEAVITETAPSASDQPAETEGPLAGLHGVIPIAPAGSARRPKPVSLTLQASDEQQASAILLEEILGTETSPRALVSAPVVTSQQWLRWVLTGVILLVLSAVILLRSQLIPVSTNLPEHAGGLSNAVMSIPANSRVLVVIDYEPSLAGEMEAIGGPLLDQIALLSQPALYFISTSPNGVALVERLLANTNIRPSVLDVFNLGYLPGGSAGALGFIEAPSQIIPSAGVGSFSEYSALVVLTDHAESGRVWVEQLQNRKSVDLALTNQPLLMVASAQAGPLLQPYVSSRQVTGMISGLADAARYEFVNNSRPGLARSYWDTFGIGLMMSVALIIVGSVWSLFTGMRARRATAE